MGVDEDIAESVRLHGWHFISVYDHEPPFLYSIGLMPDHPELIVFGLESNDAAAILRGSCKIVKHGGSFEDKKVYQIGAPVPSVSFRNVHPTQVSLYLGYAMGYCRLKRLGDVQALQVFWSDKLGKFPFDDGCDEQTYAHQPRLDIGLTPREVAAYERQWE
jgi:hypothetical protein